MWAHGYIVGPNLEQMRGISCSKEAHADGRPDSVKYGGERMTKKNDDDSGGSGGRPDGVAVSGAQCVAGNRRREGQLRANHRSYWRSGMRSAAS